MQPAPPALDVGTIGRTAAQLLATAPAEPTWQVPGLSAPGWTVKFAGREKTGKGTLVFYLLGALERSLPTVFGPPAAEPITALIYTEEPLESIREKVERSGLSEATIVFGWELTKLDGWAAKADYLVKRASDDGHGVIFVDNIARATGATNEDENGRNLAKAAEKLGELAQAAGLTLWIDHHHRKGAGQLEDKSRGGTALSGACDVNVEIERIGDWTSRARRISARGRLSATVWEQTITLAEDGRSYRAVSGADGPADSKTRQRLRMLADAGEAGLTVAEFMESAEITKAPASRALAEYVEQGRAEIVPDSKPRRYRIPADADEVAV